jgi:hypothetical protein
MLDHYWNNGAKFPDRSYIENKISHKLLLLYEISQKILQERSIKLDHLQDLSGPIHQAILRVLHNFATGDRYSNLNLLMGNRKGDSDPIAMWFDEVDVALYQSEVNDKRKRKLEGNSAAVSALMAQYAMVLHTAETGCEINEMREASYRSGIYKAVAPYRQLYVLQIIRYWVEVLCELEHEPGGMKTEDIPFFGELFGTLRCSDKLFKTRRTWEGI